MEKEEKGSNKNLYSDFAQVLNSLLDNLEEYTKFYHLKIILWLLYNNSDTLEGIIEACGIPSLTSFKNNAIFALKNKHITYNKENKVFYINKTFFKTHSNGSGYYKSLSFTMIPNKFFLSDLSKIESLAELKILLYIFRNTLGFHRNGLKFSMNVLSTRLKMSKTTISKGIEINIKVGRIYIVKNGNSHTKGTTYALSTSQNLKIMVPKDEVVVEKKKEDKLEVIDYCYTVDGRGYNYPKSRRGKNSWRNVSDKDLTFHHVLDCWIELCYVRKHGTQPFRRLDYIKYNAIIKSIKNRHFSALDLKWALGYCINVIMKEAHKEAKDLYFHMIPDYIGLAPKTNI